MSEESEWWNYRKKRMMEQEIVELNDEIAELERTVENLQFRPQASPA